MTPNKTHEATLKEAHYNDYLAEHTSNPIIRAAYIAIANDWRRKAQEGENEYLQRRA